MPRAPDGYNASTMKATRNFRRPRVLIVGCGEVAMRSVPLLQPPAHIFALTSHAGRCAELRAAGAIPLVGDLDVRRSLARIAGLAPTVLHLAPPPKSGDDDTRTRALLATLAAPRNRGAGAAAHRASRTPHTPVGRQRHLRAAWAPHMTAQTHIVPDGPSQARRLRVPPRIVYASTSGVYGDCGGALIDETRAVAPENARAKRRVSAERQLRRAAVRGVISACIARIPGI